MTTTNQDCIPLAYIYNGDSTGESLVKVCLLRNWKKTLGEVCTADAAKARKWAEEGVLEGRYASVQEGIDDISNESIQDSDPSSYHVRKVLARPGNVRTHCEIIWNEFSRDWSFLDRSAS